MTLHMPALLSDLAVRDRITRSWERFQTWVLEDTPDEPDWDLICQESTKHNTTQPHLHQLPKEIQIKIFLSPSLDGGELVRLSSVCKHWRYLFTDSFLWKSLFDRDEPAWKTISSMSEVETHSLWQQPSTSQPSLVRSSSGQSLIDWKRVYMSQYLQNIRRLTPTLADKLGGVDEYQLRLPFKKKVHRVPMFGTGMSTKHLLYEILWRKNSPFSYSSKLFSRRPSTS
jgi:hypothetical protein